MDKIKELLKNKTLLKYILYFFYIIITVGVLFSLLNHSAIRNFFSTIENKTFDVRQNILAPYKKVNKNIVILSADEESYEYLIGKYGEWPISRNIYADIITYLEKQKPAVVAFDLMFVKSLKSSNNADGNLAKNIAKYDNVYTSINFDNQSFDLRKPADLPAYLKADVKNYSDIDLKNSDLNFMNCRVIIDEILNSASKVIYADTEPKAPTAAAKTVEEKAPEENGLPKIEETVQNSAEDDAADVSANIISNFAKMFAEKKEDIAAAETAAPAVADFSAVKFLGEGSKTIEQVVENVIREIISSTVSDELAANVDIIAFAKEEIEAQTKEWLDANLPSVVENAVQKEIERVMAKVGK